MLVRASHSPNRYYNVVAADQNGALDVFGFIVEQRP